MNGEACPDGALTWRIRGSLLGYVLRMAGGTCEVSGGATVDATGAFTFPLRHAVEVGDDWGLAFEGSVRLRGHHGVLDIVIADPELVMEGAGGVLMARTGSEAPGAPTPIAVTAPARAERAGAGVVWKDVRTTLVEPAVALFGDVYAAGTELAPLSAWVALTR